MKKLFLFLLIPVSFCFGQTTINLLRGGGVYNFPHLDRTYTFKQGGVDLMNEYLIYEVDLYFIQPEGKSSFYSTVCSINPLLFKSGDKVTLVRRTYHQSASAWTNIDKKIGELDDACNSRECDRQISPHYLTMAQTIGSLSSNLVSYNTRCNALSSKMEDQNYGFRAIGGISFVNGSTGNHALTIKVRDENKNSFKWCSMQRVEMNRFIGVENTVLNEYTITIENPLGFNNRSVCPSAVFPLSDLNKSVDVDGYVYSGNGVSGVSWDAEESVTEASTITASKAYLNGNYSTTFTISKSAVMGANDNFFVGDKYSFQFCRGSNNNIDLSEYIKEVYKLGITSFSPLDPLDNNGRNLSSYMNGSILDVSESFFSQGVWKFSVGVNVGGCHFVRTFSLSMRSNLGSNSTFSPSVMSLCPATTIAQNITVADRTGIWTTTGTGTSINWISKRADGSFFVTPSIVPLGIHVFNYSAGVGSCWINERFVIRKTSGNVFVFPGSDTSMCFSTMPSVIDLFNTRNLAPVFIDAQKTQWGHLNSSNQFVHRFVDGILNTSLISTINPTVDSIQSNHVFDRGIRYFLNDGGCSGSMTRNISVKRSPSPPVVVQSVYTVCSGANISISCSLPTGNGTVRWFENHPVSFSGLNFEIGSGNSLLLTSVTSNNIYYARANMNDCLSNIVAISVVVIPLPIVSLMSDMFVCKSSGNLNLQTTEPFPSGGLWSGIGIGGGTVFSPGALAPNNYVATYTITANNGCKGIGLKTLKVVENPPIIVGNNISVCGNSLPISLNDASVTTRGGFWTGSLIENNILYPDRLKKPFYDNDLGNSNYDFYLNRPFVRYTITNTVTGCVSFANRNVVILPSPVLSSFSNVANSICNSSVVILSSTGSNILDVVRWSNAVNPNSILSTGRVYNVGNISSNRKYYATSTNKFSCVSNRDSVSLLVKTSTVVKLPSDTSLCTTHVVNLNSWVSVGGVFTSTTLGLVTGSTLNVRSFVGSYFLNYLFTNSDNCVTNRRVNVTINRMPVADLSIDTTICDNNGLITLYNPLTTGVWSGVGVASGLYLNTSLLSKVNPLVYSFNVGGCRFVRNRNYIVSTPPLAPILSDSSKLVHCFGKDFTLSLASTSVAGVSNRWFDANGFMLSNSRSLSMPANQDLEIIVESINIDGCVSLGKLNIPINVVNLSGSISTKYVFYDFGNAVTYQTDIVGDNVKEHFWNIGNNYLTSDISPVVYAYDSGNVDVQVRIVSEKGCELLLERKAIIRVEGSDFKRSVTSVRENLTLDAVISPNPFTNSFKIQVNNANLYSVQIYSSIGVLVPSVVSYNDSNIICSSDSFMNGIYVVVLIDKESGKSFKFKVSKS